jgi:glyoxylase-like metal-dependent hydrolase (beta-lactamase superfamily II)
VPAAGTRIAPWRRPIGAGLAMLLMIAVLLVAQRLHWIQRGGLLAPVLAPSTVTIAPGIHLLGGLDPAAAYAVETPEGLVLIDSGLEPDARLLREQLSALGLGGQRLRAILLTHVHGDHSGGAETLRRTTGAKVYAGHADAAILRAGGPRDAFVSAFYMPDVTPHPTTVDVELWGDEVLDFGGVRFRALATGGHTPGSVCYLLEHNGVRVLFSGDVIMSLIGNETAASHLARPLGTYPAYLSPRYRGSAQAFLLTLRQLRALPAPDLVLPGHPRRDRTPQSPSMSQARWQALLDDGIRDMEALLARYERDGARFLDGTAQELLPDLYYLGDLEGAAVYGFFAASRFFMVDAPGGPALGDFLKARLNQLGRKPAVPAVVLLTSCDPQATAGLRQLIETSHAKVVVSPVGLTTVKDVCPPGTTIVSADALPDQGWFDVQPLSLAGRGLAPMAYRVRWAGKTVLFSGQIPVGTSRPAGMALRDDFARAPGDRPAYAASLDRLALLKPDLWLPLFSTDGQSARLYDADWDEVLAANRRVLRYSLQESP